MRIASASVIFSPAPVGLPGPARPMMRALPLATARSWARRCSELLTAAARCEPSGSDASCACSVGLGLRRCPRPGTWPRRRCTGGRTRWRSPGPQPASPSRRRCRARRRWRAADTLTPLSDVRRRARACASSLATAAATSLERAIRTLVAAVARGVARAGVDAERGVRQVGDVERDARGRLVGLVAARVQDERDERRTRARRRPARPSGAAGRASTLATVSRRSASSSPTFAAADRRTWTARVRHDRSCGWLLTHHDDGGRGRRTPSGSARGRSGARCRGSRPRRSSSRSKARIASASASAVCGVEEDAGDAVDDAVADPARAVGDDRHAGGLGLDGHDAEVLLAGEEQGARAGQQRRRAPRRARSPAARRRARRSAAAASSARPAPTTLTVRPSLAQAASARSTRL